MLGKRRISGRNLEYDFAHPRGMPCEAPGSIAKLAHKPVATIPPTQYTEEDLLYVIDNLLEIPSV